jgi:hypothetical protein
VLEGHREVFLVELTFEQVKEFIEKNKDIDESLNEYLQGFKKVSVEEIQQMVQTDKDLAKWFESERDRHATKAINTFKEKTMPKIIEEEIKKRTTGKDEKDLELEKLKDEINKIKRDKLRESLKNEAFKFANENKLPVDLTDYFIKIESDDDETGTKSKELTYENLNRLKEIWTNHLQQVVNDKLKSNGFNPKETGGTPKTLTKEQLLSMTSDEIAKLDQKLVNEALKNS